MSAKRLGVAMLLLAVLAAPAAAQNARERRDQIANPPPPPAPSSQAATVAPSRWGTLGTQVGQPQWGNMSTPGVGGATAPTR
jgi:hypothetical protein